MECVTRQKHGYRTTHADLPSHILLYEHRATAEFVWACVTVLQQAGRDGGALIHPRAAVCAPTIQRLLQVSVLLLYVWFDQACRFVLCCIAFNFIFIFSIVDCVVWS